MVFQPNLQGCYAVYALPENACLVQVGRKGLIRHVVGPEVPGSKDTFVVAGDLSGKSISVHGFAQGKSGLRSLRLVPVTRESVDSWSLATRLWNNTLAMLGPVL